MWAELAKMRRNYIKSRKEKDLNYYLFYILEDKYAFVIFPNRSTASILNDKNELIEEIKHRTPELTKFRTSMISFDALSANRNAWVGAFNQ